MFANQYSNHSNQSLDDFSEQSTDQINTQNHNMSCEMPTSSVSSAIAMKEKQVKNRVTFSQSSKLHIFPSEAPYLKQNTYNRADRKQFMKEALIDAIKIKKLIANAPGNDSADAICFLFQASVISQEEVLGIEHYILDPSAAKTLKTRRSHAEALLLEQSRHRQNFGGVGKKKLDDFEGKLAHYSTARSLKSVKKARIRAALAA